MNTIFSPFDSILGDVFYPSVNNKSLKNKADIIYDGEQYTLHLEVPGLTKEQLHMEIDGKRVSIKSEQSVLPDKKTNYILNEIGLPSVSRSFLFPETIDENSVSATLENGVLTVILKAVKTKKRILIN